VAVRGAQLTRQRWPEGFACPGFAALSVLPNAGSKSLDGLLKDKVRPGSHVLTDGWSGSWHVEQNGFAHTAIDLSKQDQPAHKLFPWVHITLSNLKRFLLGNPPHRREQTPQTLRRRVQLQTQPKNHGRGPPHPTPPRQPRHPDNHIQTTYRHA
jgi:hypothetical protein